MLSNIDYFYIGCPTQLKKNKRENGPSQQLLMACYWHNSKTLFLSLILIPKRQDKTTDYWLRNMVSKVEIILFPKEMFKIYI